MGLYRLCVIEGNSLRQATELEACSLAVKITTEQVKTFCSPAICVRKKKGGRYCLLCGTTSEPPT